MCLCSFKNSVVALEFIFRKGCLCQKVITAIYVQNEMFNPADSNICMSFKKVPPS